VIKSFYILGGTAYSVIQIVVYLTKIESAFNKINPDVVFVEGVSVKGDKEVF